MSTAKAKKKTAPPTPEVQYLPQIFRRIQAGDIREPAFQRGFVWSDDQVLELLESIYRGFPIGSALLWKVENPIVKVEDPIASFFPTVKDSYPTHFVLDGLQRLSTLYAVFHYSSRAHPLKFDVLFDLRKKTFSAAHQTDNREACIALNQLFVPKDFLKRQQELSTLPDADNLLEATVELHSTFQEYQLPLVTISGQDIHEVVRIFERVNSTGTKLGAVDFMRAVTWSGDFDLNRQISTVSDAMSAEGFSIPQETLVKVFAISLGKLPSSDSMLELRNMDPAGLNRGVKLTTELLRRTISYLDEYLHIKSYALVPYEGQFLMLARFFADKEKPPAPLLRTLTRWFWTVSLNEELQGRSEFKVAQKVEQIGAFRAGDKSALQFSLELTAATLTNRRFRIGAALSSAFASLLAHSNCRSLVSGNIIDPDTFMTEDAGRNFAPLVTEISGKPIPKVIANTFVVTNEDLSKVAERDSMAIVKRLVKDKKDEASRILASQLIEPEAIDALMKNQNKRFLEYRAKAILSYASKLVEGKI